MYWLSKVAAVNTYRIISWTGLLRFQVSMWFTALECKLNVLFILSCEYIWTPYISLLKESSELCSCSHVPAHLLAYLGFVLSSVRTLSVGHSNALLESIQTFSSPTLVFNGQPALSTHVSSPISLCALSLLLPHLSMPMLLRERASVVDLCELKRGFWETSGFIQESSNSDHLWNKSILVYLYALRCEGGFIKVLCRRLRLVHGTN